MKKKGGGQDKKRKEINKKIFTQFMGGNDITFQQSLSPPQPRYQYVHRQSVHFKALNPHV